MIRGADRVVRSIDLGTFATVGDDDNPAGARARNSVGSTRFYPTPVD